MPLSQGARVLNRRRFIVGAALIAAAVSYLVYAGIRTTSMYYFELGEFVARRDALLGETLRVKGWVKHGSVRWDAHTNELAFELATKDGGSPVPVAYRGIRPDMFSEGREVVVEGRYRRDRLAPPPTMTRRPPQYKPPARGGGPPGGAPAPARPRPPPPPPAPP